MNGAGATHSDPATKLAAGETKFIADHPQEWRVVRTLHGEGATVEIERGHDRAPAVFSIGTPLHAGSGYLLFDVGPGRLVRASATQICGKPCDIDICKRCCVAGHYQACATFCCANPIEHDVDKVRRLWQRQRAVEREFRSHGKRRGPGIVVTTDASAGIKLR